MLWSIGRLADGWMRSPIYLPDGPASLPAMSEYTDKASATTGPVPAAITWFLDTAEPCSRSGGGLFEGPPEQWAELALCLRLHHRLRRPGRPCGHRRGEGCGTNHPDLDRQVSDGADDVGPGSSGPRPMAASTAVPMRCNAASSWGSSRSMRYSRTAVTCPGAAATTVS